MGKIATPIGKVSTFRLTSAIARQLAEQRWGRGGTSADKCNRPGAYYFSCSGHGGYVIDAKAFTPEERAKIDQFRTPEPLKIFVQGDDVLAVFGPDAMKTKRIWIDPAKGQGEWQSHPVYYFEEDCDWSIVEMYSTIRSAWAAKCESEDPTSYNANRASCARYHLEPRFWETAA